jgi:hypothetical protein
MKKNPVADETAASSKADNRQARLNLPGFIREDVGLGDVLTHVTHALGVPTCGGCARRAQRLNSWLTFKGWGS